MVKKITTNGFNKKKMSREQEVQECDATKMTKEQNDD